jgi:hypothetical protein
MDTVTLGGGLSATSRNLPGLVIGPGFFAFLKSYIPNPMDVPQALIGKRSVAGNQAIVAGYHAFADGNRYQT